MLSPLPEDVRQALAEGQKIEAIRLLRMRAGLGLAEAKAAVESGVAPTPASEEIPVSALPAEVRTALEAGNAIEAIRLLRKASGLGLKNAKAVIDAAPLGRKGGAVPGEPGLAPGEVPRSGASAGALVLVVVLVALVAWLLMHSA